MYKLRSLQEYKAAMDLRNNLSWGAKRISSFLLNKGINITRTIINARDSTIWAMGKPIIPNILVRNGNYEQCMNAVVLLSAIGVKSKIIEYLNSYAIMLAPNTNKSKIIKIETRNDDENFYNITTKSIKSNRQMNCTYENGLMVELN